MNLTEAQAIVQEISVFQGKVMRPFHRPVEDFLIVPAAQKEFDDMFRDIKDNESSFDVAILPYSDNVTILVCFEQVSGIEGAQYCSYEYFCEVNNIADT